MGATRTALIAAIDDLAREGRRARAELATGAAVAAGSWPLVELQDLCKNAPESAVMVVERLLVLEAASAVDLDVLDELRGLLRWHPAVLLPRLAGWLEAYPKLQRRFRANDAERAE